MHCIVVIVNRRSIKACCSCHRITPIRYALCCIVCPVYRVADEPPASWPGSVLSSAARRTSVRASADAVRSSADIVRVNGRPSGHRTQRRQRSRPPSALRHNMVCDVLQRDAAMPRFPADCDGRRLRGTDSSAASCRRHELASQLQTPSRPGSRPIPFPHQRTALGPATKTARYPYLAPRSLRRAGIRCPLQSCRQHRQPQAGQEMDNARLMRWNRARFHH